MSLYIYAKTGHNYGLEDLRRSAYIYKALENELDPILLVSDYRACTYASEFLNIEGATSVDVIKNVANVAVAGDDLIVCSDELDYTNIELLEDMARFFRNIIVVGEKIADIDNVTYVNSTFIDLEMYDDIDDMEDFGDEYEDEEEDDKLATPVLFFGDDDYSKSLKSLSNKTNKVALLRGYYFFMGYEDEIKDKFKEIINDEEYYYTIEKHQHLITSSVYTCLESLSCGNKPILIKREDKEYDDIHILENYNIPIYEFKDLSSVLDDIDNIIQSYPNMLFIELYDESDIDISRIKKALE